MSSSQARHTAGAVSGYDLHNTAAAFVREYTSAIQDQQQQQQQQMQLHAQAQSQQQARGMQSYPAHIQQQLPPMMLPPPSPNTLSYYYLPDRGWLRLERSGSVDAYHHRELQRARLARGSFSDHQYLDSILQYPPPSGSTYDESLSLMHQAHQGPHSTYAQTPDRVAYQTQSLPQQLHRQHPGSSAVYDYTQQSTHSPSQLHYHHPPQQHSRPVASGYPQNVQQTRQQHYAAAPALQHSQQLQLLPQPSHPSQLHPSQQQQIQHIQQQQQQQQLQQLYSNISLQQPIHYQVPVSLKQPQTYDHATAGGLVHGASAASQLQFSAQNVSQQLQQLHQQHHQQQAQQQAQQQLLHFQQLMIDQQRQGQEQQQQQQQQQFLIAAAAAAQQLQHQHAHAQIQATSSVPTGPLSITKVQLPQTPQSQLVVQVQLADGKAQQLVINARDEEWRDHLLSYAHMLYASEAANPSPTSQLIPILQTITTFHKNHLPTLLLLACVYYTQRNYKLSLHYNHLILTKDPHYVEAMSNIGTTLRSMSRQPEAESWWWKAVRLRPGYWDAVENLIGVLCSGYGASESQQTQSSTVATPSSAATSEGATSASAVSSAQNKAEKPVSQPPRYKEALKICEFVEANVLPDPTDLSGDQPPPLPIQHTPRLQNLLYAKGNLKYALGDIAGARREYERSLEIVFGPGIGAIQAVNEIITMTYMALGYPRPTGRELEGAMLLLRPEEALQVTQVVFRETNGVLPGLAALVTACSEGGANNAQNGISVTLWQQANQTTSTILLTLAKLYQDVMDQPAKAKELAGSDNFVPSMSMLLPLYYLSLALNPSPSTCNNLGILLSSIPPTAKTISYPQPAQAVQLQVQANGLVVPAPAQPAYPLTGQALALQFYNYGLQLDPRHPHLYTNLGSLLKDMGQLNEAVAMYEKAVECNPRFDVALANLGNAVKDLGKVQDSIQWYLRAVEINPNFSEAVCGLVNALGGVCDWRGRGGVGPTGVTADGQLIVLPITDPGKPPVAGWMGRVSEIVEKQLNEGALWGAGLVRVFRHDLWQLILRAFLDSNLKHPDVGLWQARLDAWCSRSDFKDRRNEGGWIIRLQERAARRLQRKWYLENCQAATSASSAPGSTIPRRSSVELSKSYQRPMLPPGMAAPPVPTVLPFHTFTYPLTARQIRLISHRNALRISHGTLMSHWLPSTVYPPPPPPTTRLKVGYVSSDFNNHPLSHLMQSVFGMHDKARFEVFCYATTPADQTPYRAKIQSEVEHFMDVSTWGTQAIVDRIVKDGIHVLVNLNGYTKGARNEVFAARPSPVQVSFMGFAGTLGAGWCDYIVADPVVCPPEMVSGVAWKRKQRSLILERSLSKTSNGHHDKPSSMDSTGSSTLTTSTTSGKRRSRSGSEQDMNVTSSQSTTGGSAALASIQNEYSDFEGDVDPEDPSDDWVYTEKFIYMPHSYFVNDHRQGFREEEKEQEKRLLLATEPQLAMSTEWSWILEQDRRWQMRKELFPGLAENTVIFANFNQLYKIDPQIFKTWLQILARVPNSILWLLRFPSAGEPHLLRTAREWAGPAVASRVVFTDVAPKHVHIHRGRIADLFLDTPECNAHTTAADILWSGTPILTFPKYSHKMCSRVGASIAYATGRGGEMIVNTEQEYEDKAVAFAQGCRWEYVEDSVLRRQLGLPPSAVTSQAIGAPMASGANAVPGATMGPGHLQNFSMAAQAQLGVSQLQQPLLAQSVNQLHFQAQQALGVSTPGLLPQAQASQVLQPPVQPQSVVHWIGHGPLIDLRRDLWESRDRSLLFDTLRWTRNLEKGYCEAWRRWETGQEFDELLEHSAHSLSGRRASAFNPPGTKHRSTMSGPLHHGNIVVSNDGEVDGIRVSSEYPYSSVSSATSTHAPLSNGYVPNGCSNNERDLVSRLTNGSSSSSSSNGIGNNGGGYKITGANEGSVLSAGSLGSGPAGSFQETTASVTLQTQGVHKPGMTSSISHSTTSVANGGSSNGPAASGLHPLMMMMSPNPDPMAGASSTMASTLAGGVSGSISGTLPEMTQRANGESMFYYAGSSTTESVFGGLKARMSSLGSLVHDRGQGQDHGHGRGYGGQGRYHHGGANRSPNEDEGYGIPEGQIDPGQHGEPRRASSSSSSSHSGGGSGVELKAKFERLEQQIRRPDLGCIFVCD